jgi:hypothetical protein
MECRVFCEVVTKYMLRKVNFWLERFKYSHVEISDVVERYLVICYRRVGPIVLDICPLKMDRNVDN